MRPEIDDRELEWVVAALAVINPGKADEGLIRDIINANWPFKSIGTGGWVAYLEGGSNPNRVRLAIQPYTAARFINKN